ncbi:DnaJ domain containing protein [Leishmania braziliensis]|nr:DnaJ domain containing protein [Leishmania braziliensis]
MQTLYDILNVPMGASQNELQHAYRRLLTRYHPDRCYHDNDSVAYNTNRKLDKERMCLLQQAYKVLANPHKRSEYDAYLAQKLASDSATYHLAPQQVRRLQGMTQPQVFAFGGGATRSVSGIAGDVKAMEMPTVKNSSVSATAGVASAARQLTSTQEGACRGGAVHLHYANPMTRALATPFRVAETSATTVQEEAVDFAKSPSPHTLPYVPVVYTASVSMRRGSDDTLPVPTMAEGSFKVHLVVHTDGIAASGAQTSTAWPQVSPQHQEQPSAASPTAVLSALSHVPLPRRVRIIQEHLVILAGDS